MTDRIQQRILDKPALRAFYQACYERYRICLTHCPPVGATLELGSGFGFAKHFIPNLITSDVIPRPGLDRLENACQLSFPDNSLRTILMLDTFHHIPDAAAFLSEAQRCLITGGRLLMIEPFPGYISSFVNRWLHHEHWNPQAGWQFTSRDPYLDANGALPWIVFVRDQQRFRQHFPNLRIARITPHTPLLYWLSGGLHPWTLLPKRLIPFAQTLDKFLTQQSVRWGSFADIELVKEPADRNH